MSNDKNNFQIGATCYAKDFANSWYKSKIVDLDLPNNRVKVHFLGWNSRYDQWFDMENGDIKLTLNDSDTKTSQNKPVTNKKSKSTKLKTEQPATTPVNTTPEIRYSIGSKISAKWIDENFYPAQVLRHVMKMSILYYEVRFYDGVKKLVRFNNTRDLTEEELIFYYPSTITTNDDNINNINQLPIVTSTNNENKSTLTQEDRRAEAELLLGIQQTHVREGPLSVQSDTKSVDTASSNEPAISKTDTLNTPNDSNLRKSSRVKRLKTFKDEIVFYSSSQIIFNNTDQDTPSSSNKKRKSITDIKIDTKQNESEDKNQTPSVDEGQNELSRDFTNKNKLEQLRLKSFKPKDTTKKSLKENLQNTQKRISKLQEKMDKKSKKEKKERIKELIETNQRALKLQQELIEKHLKQRQHMKLKKKMLKMLRKQNKQKFQIHTSQIAVLQKNQIDPLDDFKYEDLIRCNFSNCDKTFRKQHLLEYHLKYHHYVDVNFFSNYESNQQYQIQQITNLKPTTTTKKTHKSNSNETVLNDKLVDVDDVLFEEDNYCDDDPYDVVHCQCGNNKSDGFMIQCEICLCWQHRVCLHMNRDEDVPKNHYCWICNEPDNKLKKLKYQSWMQMKSIRQNENENKTKKKTKLKSVDTVRIDDPSQHRLYLLNVCSKKYYNLNLLMYTLEYQTSLLDKLIKTKDNENNLKDQIEKLTLNIQHLQSCALKKFDEFNFKLEELEKSQSNLEENTLPRFFNLQELYNQLQSLVYQ